MIFQDKKSVLGTEAILTLSGVDAKLAIETFSALWQLIEVFENKFSRFLPASELSLFNKMAGQRAKVSPEFLALIKKSVEMWKESNQIFNPLVLPLLQKEGYLGSWPKPEERILELDFSSRELGKVEEIKTGPNWAKIPENCALDFGGIGKGFLLDQLATFLDERGITNYWLSLGKDLILSGQDEQNEPWQIDVEAALNENIAITQISTKGQKVAIASSSIMKRGVKDSWHHLIDPLTGKSAKTDVLMATVLMENGVSADIFAKTLVILGSKEAEKILKNNNIKEAILQYTDGSITKKSWREI